jgi:alkylation response protein AidB-like acyl-CoA dehydrogenase
MRFDLTDEQLTIQRTVGELLVARLPAQRLRTLLDEGAYDTVLWRELRELGFAGLTVPEEHGGQGLGLLELGLVAEELGKALAPVPLVANAGAGLLLQAASPADRAAHLPGIASGERRGAFAVLRDGTDPLAIDALDADVLVVSDGAAGWLGAPADIGEEAPTLDLLRRYAVVRGHGQGAALGGELAGAIDAVEVLLSAELVGVAQRALDLAVAYAGEREQFGRLIGTFQGVSHLCATMLLDVETARSTWRYAAWVAGNRPQDLPLAASTAKVAAATAAWNATAGSLQVLGGIGFTWEHDVHLLMRRAKVGAQVLGPPAEHRRRIARILREAVAETDRVAVVG